MTVECFTREEFESALPVDRDSGQPLWKSLGLDDGEFCYLIPVNESPVFIKVRSTIKPNGISANVGKDSIRAWLVDEAGQPLGAKVLRWTTRQPGWQERLTQILRTLYTWRLRAGDCPDCDKPLPILKARTKKNDGRPYARCPYHGHFRWLDEKPAQVYFAQGSAPSSLGADEPLPNEKTNEKEEREAGSPVPSGNGTVRLSDVLDKSRAPLPNLEDEEESNEESSEPDLVSSREPNPEQRQAIEAPIDAAVRVLAPPGSGKTFVLTHRYAYLLEHGANPEGILAVTFSKTMADELLQRIARVNPSIKETAAMDQVCTIHAICYRMLRADGDRRKVAKDWQIKRAIQEIAEKLWPYVEERPGWSEIYLWINQAKFHNLNTADDLSFFLECVGDYHGRNLHEARRRFDERMRDEGLLTFPDMLFDVEQKLERDVRFRDRWQAKFKWLVVDEAQDTSAQAMRILTTLAKPQDQFFCVSDVDQLLYRFAGSTPEGNVYAGFEERYPGGLLIKLSVNYRSTKEVIDHCTNLIVHNYQANGGPYEEKYLKTVEPCSDAGQGVPITFQMYDSPSTEAQALADALVESLANDRGPGDFFVGARTRAQLGYLEGSLVRAKIPFINLTGGSFWDSKPVADIIAYLRLAYDNSDSEAFQRIYNVATNWNVHVWGENKGEYCSHRYLGRAFLEACTDHETKKPSYKWVWRAVQHRKSFGPGVENLVSFVEQLQSELAQAQSPAEVLTVIIQDCYRKYLLHEEGVTATDEAENGKLEDLATVIEVASSFTDVEKFLAFVNEAVKASEAAKDKAWDNYVVISTIHRLKGLERPIVYGIGWCEGIDPKSGEPRGLLPHTFSLVPPLQDGILPTGGKGRLEDERCIAFVLVSRAKEEVHLSGVKKYRTYQLSPSRFVAELGLRESEPGANT